ncbi:CBO0543 family protein [Fredinandcohnia sp. 179-A 10B2 NHS]|uniref:CBO0543 family protein n=1 Tax=Fredinandcohnia sp. 179-A 10B2 NHS TaxID=3235176 RepID=UPI00399FCED0
MEPVTIFVSISSFLFALVAYIMPKKMKPYEIYATSLFATLFGLFVDTILAVKYKLYVLDQPGIQIPALIGQVVLYYATNVIILNSFPYEKSVKWKVIHIVCFTSLAITFEIISNEFGFIKYNEWNIWYSALSYPFLIYFLVLHFSFFKWLVNR